MRGRKIGGKNDVIGRKQFFIWFCICDIFVFYWLQYSFIEHFYERQVVKERSSVVCAAE
jgi:hypothetical protein